MVNSSGYISTIAGNYYGASPYDNIILPARETSLNFPIGLAINRENGNIYFADMNNMVVRKVSATGCFVPLPSSGLYVTEYCHFGSFYEAGQDTKVKPCTQSGNGYFVVEECFNGNYDLLGIDSKLVCDYSYFGKPLLNDRGIFEGCSKCPDEFYCMKNTTDYHDFPCPNGM